MSQKKSWLTNFPLGAALSAQHIILDLKQTSQRPPVLPYLYCNLMDTSISNVQPKVPSRRRERPLKVGPVRTTAERATGRVCVLVVGGVSAERLGRGGQRGWVQGCPQWPLCPAELDSQSGRSGRPAVTEKKNHLISHFYFIGPRLKVQLQVGQRHLVSRVVCSHNPYEGGRLLIKL